MKIKVYIKKVGVLLQYNGKVYRTPTLLYINEKEKSILESVLLVKYGMEKDFDYVFEEMSINKSEVKTENIEIKEDQILMKEDIKVDVVDVVEELKPKKKKKSK